MYASPLSTEDYYSYVEFVQAERLAIELFNQGYILYL
ncbi:MAG: hypothetical protein AB202_03120 [Parcubacteria bacterium C7867-007]|nr:MAG: hypothetical protein AB202_03120 [Parcubacteria bacterium C7867-007]